MSSCSAPRLPRLPGRATAFVLALVLLGLAAAPAEAQRSRHYKNGAAVKAVFRDVVGEAHNSVVQVCCDDKTVALGTVVAADGWVLTKASNLAEGEVVCRMYDGATQPAKLAAIDDEYDLALLKLPVEGLTAPAWNESTHFTTGQWVVTPDRTGRPLAIGVVSVPRREIRPARGLLGITIEDGDPGPRIVDIGDNSAAQESGMKVGDLITHIQDRRTRTRRDLVGVLRRYQAGSVVKVTYQRDDEEKTVQATLKPADPPFQDRIGGYKLSARAAGFPTALQHDSVLRPEQCGGPLLDVDGKVVGINIARAGRVVSYAIPADVVMGLLPGLKASSMPDGQSVAGGKTDKPDAQVETGTQETMTPGQPKEDGDRGGK